MQLMELSPKESMTIIFWAFRYCITRRSYAVGDMCDCIRKHGHSFDDRTKKLMIHELKEEFARDDRGIIQQNEDMEFRGEPEWTANRHRVFMQQDRDNWESALKSLENR